MFYTLPELPYGYDALEPMIDKETMKVHHQGHHQGYVDKLNEAVAEYPQFQLPVPDLLTSLDELPDDLRETVRNQGGGHENHSLFWTLLSPKKIQVPKELSLALQTDFGSLENFKKAFNDSATEHFASGWTWLCMKEDGKMEILSTSNHDNPLTQGLEPLLVLDLWEHAYYLKHQNKRKPYLQAFWKIVNWAEVHSRWQEILKSGHTDREWALAG